MLKSEYAFKYLPAHSNRVYIVTLDKNNTTGKHDIYSRKTGFLTQSVQLKSRDEQRNVIVAFHTETIMSYCLPTILLQRRPTGDFARIEHVTDAEDGVARIHMTELSDVMIHSSLMRMPLLVYMNAYCHIDEARDREVFDVFFYDDSKNTHH